MRFSASSRRQRLPVGDEVDAGVAEDALDLVLGHVALAAHDLHAVVDDAPAVLGAEGLADGGLDHDVVVLAVVFTLFLGWTRLRHSLQSVHAVARPTIGAVVFPIGLLLAAVVLWPHPAAFSYAALMLAGPDAAAGIVGTRFASPTWRVAGGEKSMLGSLTFFVVAFALGLVFALATGSGAIAGAAAVALAVMAIEGVLGYGLDNLFIPVVAGLLGEQWLSL